jgi:hypothetical protein
MISTKAVSDTTEYLEKMYKLYIAKTVEVDLKKVIEIAIKQLNDILEDDC